MATRMSPRDLAYSALFGAAAMLLPTLFHLVHLGHVFMPMYLPLVALAFFVSPLAAATTSVLVPLLSGAVTGMPPFYPPVAVSMAIELAAMSGLLAAVKRRWPRTNDWLVLATVLVMGRVLNLALVFSFGKLMHLPAAYLAGASFLSGWPGLILMMVVVPFVVRTGRTLRNDRVE